jgi:hypothetical protein
VALAPNLEPFIEMLQVSEAEEKKAITAWGPGKFDAQLNLDGKAFRPDGKTAATLNRDRALWRQCRQSWEPRHRRS